MKFNAEECNCDMQCKAIYNTKQCNIQIDMQCNIQCDMQCQTTFVQNNIYSKQYFLKTTLAQNNISSKQQ